MKNSLVANLLLILVSVFFAVINADLRKGFPIQPSTENLPECSPDNLKLANASIGQWYLLPDGTFTYEFPHCKLRRFTRTTASKCLKGSHLVFMGDSLSRYFYLSLAYLFAHNDWSLKFARLPGHLSLPKSILSERDFQNWSLFYHKSNKLLNKGRKIIEICDCFRNDSRPFIPAVATDPHQQLDCLENRHFRYIPDVSSSGNSNNNGFINDQENDVRLSYIQWYGLMPMRGHTSISSYPRNESIFSFIQNLNQNLCPRNGESFHPMSRYCADQRIEGRDELHRTNFPDFCHQLDDCANIHDHSKETKCQRFERDVLGAIGTTHVLLNVGWHAGLQHCDPRFLEKVVDGAERYFAKPGPSKSSSSSSFQPNIKLAPVTWRAATHGAVFEHDGEKLAKAYYEKEYAKKKFDYFNIYHMTQVLREYHYKIEGKDNNGLRKMIHLSHSWPKDREVNISTVHTTWVDVAHLEPWAYAQIHDVFLNSVCPIDLK